LHIKDQNTRRAIVFPSVFSLLSEEIISVVVVVVIIIISSSSIIIITVIKVIIVMTIIIWLKATLSGRAGVGNASE